MTSTGERDCTTSNARMLSHDGDKKKLRDEKTEHQKKAADSFHTSCWLCHDPIFIDPHWFSAPPGLALPMGSRPDYWRKELLYRGGDIERNTGPRRALPPRGRDVLVQDFLPTTSQRYDVGVSEFEKYMRVRDIHGLKNSSTAVSINWVTLVSSISESALRQAASGPGPAG